MKLTYDDIIAMHDQAISQFGGINGVRDRNAIESVLNNIYATFGGVELYPEVTSKASFLAFGLIKNHAFLDGNKRIGTATLLTFLNMNGYEIEATNEELVELALDIAQSKKDQEEIKSWIEDHHKVREKSKSFSV